VEQATLGFGTLALAHLLDQDSARATAASASADTGGGFKAGRAHGRTDDLGYKAVDSRVSCPDLLATILHQLGIDHNRLKYAHHGREESLTDSPVTHARVVEELLEPTAHV
jgi:Protein of unknown function (DUF1501)